MGVMSTLQCPKLVEEMKLFVSQIFGLLRQLPNVFSMICIISPAISPFLFCGVFVSDD